VRLHGGIHSGYTQLLSGCQLRRTPRL